ncbi:MAG: sugar phosphate isomerase/epimerase [Neomegalonema sp.]|nr:sugar phosphate isomerase/epimerase [Neomegalonema sp.]
MSRPLFVAHLTAIDLPPPAFIEAAARAGFEGVGLRLLRVTESSPGYPLMDDAAMLADTKAAMAATGLRVADIEFVKIEPDTAPETLAPLLDVGAELGARHLITAPYDPDLSRMADRLSALSELAAARNIRLALEFFPWTVLPDLSAARAMAARCDDAIGILVDSLHFDRSGSSLAELKATPPELLPFAHICDAPVAPPYTEAQLLHAARAERLPPGDGEIDLPAIIEALPPDIPLAAEAPMSALSATAGHDETLRRVFEATRKIVDGAGR